MWLKMLHSDGSEGQVQNKTETGLDKDNAGLGWMRKTLDWAR